MSAMCLLYLPKKLVFSIVLVCFYLSITTSAAAEIKDSPALIQRYALSFTQLGRKEHIQLRGILGEDSLAFGIRGDEQVEQLRVDLRFRYSLSLLEKVSHLNVLLNGMVVATVPLPSQQAGETSAAMVDLPLSSLGDHNKLGLQLVGHYTMGCENPMHPDIWVDIDPESRLLIETKPLHLPDDLSRLPAPFFYTHDVRLLELPFVLPKATDARLEAASMLASWFGALASYRGARFTVQSENFPAKGHAVVVLGPSDSLSGLDIPRPQGPLVAIRANPNDPRGKLLIVTGRNDKEIKLATLAVVTGNQALNSDAALVRQVQTQPRRPYDAPNWLTTDRPVSFGELLPMSEFSVNGHLPAPINIPLRLPPDLSDWHKKNVPINLLYRNSTVTAADKGSLDVAINHHRLQRINLVDNTSSAQEWLNSSPSGFRQKILVPLPRLASQATMQFLFRYPTPPQEDCRGSFVDTRRSTIDPNSTIDLSELSHHIAMPDLAAFSTAGFPFTRMADFSETLVVLPKNASELEYATLLTLLGRAGKATGYPVTRIEITSVAELPSLENKDILIFGSGVPTGLLYEWQRFLPISDNSKLNNIDGWLKKILSREFFSKSNKFLQSDPEMTFSRLQKEKAYFSGFESPVSKGRSVVVVSGSSSINLLEAVNILASDKNQEARMQGALSIMRNEQIEPHSIEKNYYVGSLGWYESILWYLAKNPLSLILIFLLGATLTAIFFYLTLRARAEKRLGKHK